MKTSFFSILAAVSLLASTAIAAPATASYSSAAAGQQNPYDRLNDRNDKDFNYGFDKKHRVTPDERKRWEEAHRKDDRKEYKQERKDDKRENKDDRKDNKRDDRNEKDFNYGFDKKHQVTPDERARWEAAHRNDGRR